MHVEGWLSVAVGQGREKRRCEDIDRVVRRLDWFSKGGAQNLSTVSRCFLKVSANSAPPGGVARGMGQGCLSKGGAQSEGGVRSNSTEPSPGMTKQALQQLIT